MAVGVMRSLETDYLVVGAGAMGMAFTDALVDHADVHVTLVDRRHAAGGHWLDAYPFVQLHQASLFYGVASTILGTGAVQTTGPETGLQERARVSEIRAYYDRVLYQRFIESGRVTFLGGSEYRTDGSSHLITSLVSGETAPVKVRRRVVDATYLSPTIPATTPAPFPASDDVRVAPIHELASLTWTPRAFVIVGSGKTATDGIIWLLLQGVPQDRIIWVRPRDPWMLDRAAVQPDPVVALELSANIMAAAASADAIDDFFLRLEASGVMLRIDRSVLPTMAKAPTLGRWELELLRTIDRVVRLGHVKHVTSREIVLDRGSVALPLRLARRALRRIRPRQPVEGAGLGPRQDPASARARGVPVLQRGACRLRRSGARRRSRAQPTMSAQRIRRRPRELGAHAGAGCSRDARVRRRARHRSLGEPVRPQPGAHRHFAPRRPGRPCRRRAAVRSHRARLRAPHGAGGRA
jgi:hypothetical protein